MAYTPEVEDGGVIGFGINPDWATEEDGARLMDLRNAIVVVDRDGNLIGRVQFAASWRPISISAIFALFR